MARYLHEDRRLAEALGGVYFPGGTQTEKEVVDARKNLRTCVVTLFGEKADFIENVIGYYRRHQSYGSFVKALGKLSKEYKTFEKNIEGVKRDLSKSSLKLANLIAKAITRIYEDWYDVYKT